MRIEAESCSEFGCAKEISQDDLQTVINDMMKKGCLSESHRKNASGFNTVYITTGVRVELLWKHQLSFSLTKAKKTKNEMVKSDLEVEVNPRLPPAYQEKLLRELMELREKLKEMKVFTALTGPVLEEISITVPTTEAELLTMDRVTPNTVNRFGAVLLECIHKFLDENHIVLKQPFCSRGLMRKQQEAAMREQAEQAMKVVRNVQTVQPLSSQPLQQIEQRNRLALPVSQYFPPQSPTVLPPNPNSALQSLNPLLPNPNSTLQSLNPLPPNQLNDIDLDEEMLKACEGIEQEILRERSQTESTSSSPASGIVNHSRYFTSQKSEGTQISEIRSSPGSTQSSPQKVNSVMKIGLRSMLVRKVVKNCEPVDCDSSLSSIVTEGSSLLGATQILKRPFSQDIYDLTLPESKL